MTIAQLIAVGSTHTVSDKFISQVSQCVGREHWRESSVDELFIFAMGAFETALVECAPDLVEQVHPHIATVWVTATNEGRVAAGQAPLPHEKWKAKIEHRLTEYVRTSLTPRLADSDPFDNSLGEVAKAALGHAFPSAPPLPDALVMLGGHFFRANQYATALFRDSGICIEEEKADTGNDFNWPSAPKTIEEFYKSYKRARPFT